MTEVSISDLSKLNKMKMVNFESTGRKMNEAVDISIDTRAIKAGQTYIAIRGERLDGHQFVEQAFDKGALIAMVDSKYCSGQKSDHALSVVPDTIEALQELAANHRKKYDIPVIGLTGSNGKTTTKEMIAHLLEQKYSVHKTGGNFNNHIGCPLTLLEINSTHKAAVIEMGTNHPGEIAVLGKIVQASHGLITNIGAAHLQFFGNKKGVYEEKRALFDSIKFGGTIYINIDDPFLSDFSRADCERITFSMKAAADVRGRFKEINKDGCAVFSINDSFEVQLKTPGIHNAGNGLAAAAVAMRLGLSDSEIKNGLESFYGHDKRMQIMEYKGVKVINDAYNSNPDSVKAVLKTVSKIENDGKNIYALADMHELGEGGASAHQEAINLALSANPDVVLLMGDLMTKAAQIFNDSRIHVFSDHTQAADFLSEILAEGDLLLLKGSRAMAMERILDLLGIKEKNKTN